MSHKFTINLPGIDSVLFSPRNCVGDSSLQKRRSSTSQQGPEFWLQNLLTHEALLPANVSNLTDLNAWLTFHVRKY